MKFWKMHGLGNDYIVVDNRENIVDEGKKSFLAKKLCKRKFSVGADGIIFVENSGLAEVKMRIFNSDGSEAEMCGNGIRCLAKYCYENGIVEKEEFAVETLAGIRKVWLNLEQDGVKTVKVDMGSPTFEKGSIPMVGDGLCINEDLEVKNGLKFKVTCLSMGNPHCVIFVDDLENYPVKKFGPLIENHKFFPKKVNVEFVKVLNRKELMVRVWERGCGETLACGTGACASVVAGKILGKNDEDVTVFLPGGNLKILYQNGKVFLEGSVEKVFEGKIFGEVGKIGVC
ncbi:diaminopimelate epimerase [Candidatus Bathyarchaeota archaeon]|nr:MAG: diaminopimelate epimerase [Candidatus Bathyarchaeota archaeon]